jgi:hypothetical protein
VKHLTHVLGGIVAALVAALPLVVADPSVQHYAAQHPAVAVYLPVAVGVVRAAYKALKGSPA